jgi:hypothetical protein
MGTESPHVGNATNLGSRRQETQSRGEELAERRGLHKSIQHLVVVVEVISIRLASKMSNVGREAPVNLGQHSHGWSRL